jgi:hypothetical protein
MLDRWPHIKRFLQVKSSGRVDGDYQRWLRLEKTLSPEEQATGHEEWADFYEWRLAQRADELAADRVRRYLVAEWTDSMAYCCRRAAAFARGEDPGQWLPLRQRRPDLDLEGRAIMTDGVAQGATGSASSKMAPASSAL